MKLRKAKNTTRSPIIRSPLRTAGQSLEEYINQQQNEGIAVYVSTIVFMLVIALLEWWRWVIELPPKPLTYGLGTIIVSSFCIYKIVSLKKKIRKLRMGRDGEKAVAEFLDVQFREKGYRVFHDIVGGDFNIDHLLIGSAGVFTIETKTVSKHKNGPHEIKYDGKKVTINGYEPERNPIIQAKAQANWIKELLVDLIGKKYSVQPVVLYPGWYCKQPKGAAVWVLNPKALPAFIDNQDDVLSPIDITSTAVHLSRYVRTPDIKMKS